MKAGEQQIAPVVVRDTAPLFVCLVFFFVFCFGEHLLIFVRRPSHLFPFSERMVEAALLFKKRIGEQFFVPGCAPKH